MNDQLELNDIQGVIIRGYAKLPAAHFLLLSLKDPAAAKQWLSVIAKDITPGDSDPVESATHIAFTFNGLKALDLNQAALDSFSLEFEDGMTGKHKQFFLGDFAESAPDKWTWGGPNTEAVHVLLMLYAKDLEILDSNRKAILETALHYGLHEVKFLDTTVLYKKKEHFGFHDGISQPTIKGLKRPDSKENIIEAGEFILGYKNEYGQYTPRPMVPAQADPDNLLPPMQQDTAHDLGRNGSYIVFRQLEQNVPLFWKFMAKTTQNPDGGHDEKEMIRLASKIVGRWPNGAPLVLNPDHDGGKSESNENNFDYRQSDPDGLKCPFAAHIRRSNPKDSLDTDRATSIAIAKRHRLLRRGRSYGPPLTEKLNPLDCLNVVETNIERGLYFISINADIGRQFEFVQNGWINNEKFKGLFEERDPLVANHQNPQDSNHSGTFCIRHDGLRTRITGIPEFVKVKGGAYFFIPGLRALRFLANSKA
jgi:Dyp-type peroxidase family